MSILKDKTPMTILFVQNQEKSKQFYSALLQLEPVLDVPGMTEFSLTDDLSLGLMPEDGIMKILDNKINHPHTGSGTPRSELYLPVDDPEIYYQRLIEAGGKGISEMSLRNWGDHVAYGLDLDGHLLAFYK